MAWRRIKQMVADAISDLTDDNFAEEDEAAVPAVLPVAANETPARLDADNALPGISKHDIGPRFMTKTQALKYLNAQIAEIPGVENAGRNTPEFTKWHRDTTIVIGKIFGDDHENANHFSQVRFGLCVHTSRTTEEDYHKAFRRGLTGARAVLESMLTEIDRFWSDDATPAPAPTPRAGRPRVFVGSSTEGLPAARAIQVNLDHETDVTLWSQGVFGLGEGTLASLVSAAAEFDFAILVLTPDDLVEMRGSQTSSPRDNVLFELGFFIGSLGSERTFIVHPRDVALRLPTDLAGVTPATFVSKREDGNLRAALGATCTLIHEKVAKLGRLGRPAG
jgi:predicted nucleotide-binding protein